MRRMSIKQICLLLGLILLVVVGIIIFANMERSKSLTDGGLERMLPPLPEKENIKVEEHNILEIQIDKEERILVASKEVDLLSLKFIVKDFLLKKSDKVKVDLPIIGKQEVSEGFVSFQTDSKASYSFYLDVQDELYSAYKEIKEEYSQQFFSLSYDALDDDRKQLIDKLVPQRISGINS